MIICNGIQKHGTHALLKAVELLGVPVRYNDYPGAELWHLKYGDLPIRERETGQSMKGDLPDYAKHIFIVRNPKDAFISWMRDRTHAISTGMLMSKLRTFEDCTYVEHCEPYLAWLNHPGTLVVRYEELISDGGASIKKIADYLDVPFLEDAFPNLPGHTLTWTNEHSDYKTLSAWTSMVDQVWAEIGGNELSGRLGYAY